MAFAYQMLGRGVDQVRQMTVESNPPGANEVQIRLRASSFNYHDFVTLSGFIPGIDYPRVPMSDGCGEIVAMGERVEQLAVGDRVLPLFYPFWHSGRPSRASKRAILGETVDGCLQEFLTIDATSVVKAPTHMSDEEAATLVCAGLTAWYPLMEEYSLQNHHSVLLQGTGGVSLAALQIAKAVGATVVITSSSDEKLQRARALGADYLINYREHENWQQQVLEQLGGVDVTIDTGGQDTLGRAAMCTNTDGFIAVIGVLGGFDAAPVPVIDVMQKNISIKGITVGCAESFDRYCRFTEQHHIKPVISHRVMAAELATGVELMAAGSHFGKIAVTID